MHDPSDDITPRRGGELSEATLSALAERERTRVVAPLTEWHTLAAALRDEGIIRPPAAPVASAPAAVAFPADVPRRRPVYGWVTRAFAGVALLGVGVLAGTGLTVGREIATTIRQGIVSDSTNVVRVRVQPASETGTAVAANGGAHGAAGTPSVAVNTGFGTTTFTSAAEARRVLMEAQGAAQRAAAYLAARDTSGARIVGDRETIYQERLAALDEMAAAAQSALKDAPHDPVINQYYMSTVGARQATLQQLGYALPAGVQLRHY